MSILPVENEGMSEGMNEIMKEREPMPPLMYTQLKRRRRRGGLKHTTKINKKTNPRSVH